MKKILFLIAFGMLCIETYAQTETLIEEPEQQYSQSYVDSLSTRLKDANTRLDEIEQANEDKRIWGKGRFTKIGYNWAQTAIEGCPVEKNNWSFFISKGTTFRLHSKPIAGLVKIGLDVVWFDFMVAKYKTPQAYLDLWGDDDWSNDFGDEDYDEFDTNLGRYSLNIGMFGFGPNVGVAPFANSDIKALRPLRASVYFHYQPTVTAYLMSENGETEASFAYCNMFDLGGAITYRGISLGIEGKWGSGKFKALDSDFDEDEGFDIGFSNKFKRKFANTRLYVQFTF